MPTTSNEGDLTRTLQLAALEATEDGIVITDRDGMITWVNQAFTRMCGYHKDELIGNMPSMLRSERHDPGFFKELWSTILSGKVWRSELYNRRKDGSIYPEEESITPMLNAEGEITHFIAVKRDITLRKKHEQSQIRMKKALLARSSVNAALTHNKDEQKLLNEVCRVITDVAGYIMAWVGFIENGNNNSMITASHAARGDEDSNSPPQTWEQSESERSLCRTVIATGRPSLVLDIAHDIRCRPWREQAIQHGFKSVIALPLAHGDTPFGVLKIYSRVADAFDNDEVKLLTEMANDLSFGIMAIRREAELEQTQHQLQQAQKMEAIGHLTSGLAHDFNNLLASILGYSELSLEELAEFKHTPLHSYLQQIYYSSGRARDLVGQLLTFSRGNEFTLNPTDLRHIIKGTSSILHPMLPITTRLNMQFEKNLPLVLANPVQVQQVLMNLCINARDAIAGEGDISISLRHTDIDAGRCSACHKTFSGHLIELSVEDTGSGIAESKISKMFDPFYTTKEVGKGTGMGLAMVNGIIHKHGCHLTVSSEVGKGSRFSMFFLPSHAEGQSDAQTADARWSLAQYQLSGRVLIVDDEISVGAYIGELLKTCGCSVAVESDGQLGYERFLLAPDEFDLVIIDQIMPGMSGSELAHAILQGKPDMPIIMCSATNSEEEKSESWELGVYAHLKKPIDSMTLLSCVEEMLES